MAKDVCPWWIGIGLASPIRRLTVNPEALLGRYVSPGMTILEPGPGMGFFTLPLARLAGANGRVVAVDIQPKMLDRLKNEPVSINLLRRRGRCHQLYVKRQIRRQGGPPPLAILQEAVSQDGEQPASCAIYITQLPYLSMCHQKNLLGQVLCIMDRSGQTIGIPIDCLMMFHHQLGNIWAE